MVSSRYTRLTKWILLIMLLGAIFIRLPFLDLFRFEHEMARDIYHSEKILKGDIILRGVYADLREDSPQQSFGPLMYYLIAGSLVVAPNEYWYPLMPSILVMMLNLGAIILCYQFGKEFFNKCVGLTAAALFAFSPWFVLHVSSYASNPNYVSLFVMAFVYCLAKVIVKGQDKFLLPSFIALALATQLHLSSITLFPFLGAALVIWRKDLFTQKKLYKALGITAIFYIPYMIYIFKTGSVESVFTFAAARYPSAFLTVVGESLGIPVMFVTPYLSSYLLGSVRIMPSMVKGITALMVIGMISALSLLSYRVYKHKMREKGISLLLLWWFVPVLVYMLVGKNVSPHFFIILLPAQFLVAAVALHKVYTKYAKTAIMLVGAILLFYVFFVLKVYVVVDQNGGTDSIFGVPYKYRVEVVQKIAQETKAPKIVYYGADKRNMNWLFAHFGLNSTYQYIQSLDEFKEGYLIFDEYDFYAYHERTLPEEEKERVKNEPGTTIKHIKILRR